DCIYVGGPVQTDVIVALVELEVPDYEVPPIVGNVGYLAREGGTDDIDIARVRVCAGYSGWGPGQLEEEMAEPSWIVVRAEPGDVFAADPDEVWRSVLDRKGGKYALIATMPFDPGLN